jgi:hypothetical protein
VAELCPRPDSLRPMPMLDASITHVRAPLENLRLARPHQLLRRGRGPSPSMVELRPARPSSARLTATCRPWTPSYPRCSPDVLLVGSARAASTGDRTSSQAVEEDIDFLFSF